MDSRAKGVYTSSNHACDIISCVLDFTIVMRPSCAHHHTSDNIRTYTQVLRIGTDDDWVDVHEKLAAQLTKFHAKGDNLPHMSSPAAWRNLHSKCALQWWATWGQELPELKLLAMKLVPLMIGSGPAERTWKDVDQVLTKNRNRLKMKNCLNLVFVRTWLRREIKLVTDEELECFKVWEAELIKRASFYDGPVEPDAGRQKEDRVFEDRIEDWEQKAIDGTGPGARITLGQVRRNAAAKFKLQEKYKNLYFVDKDPNGYYPCIILFIVLHLMFISFHR